MTNACRIRVRGVVQGVGFRPFVFRLATTCRLTGWVLNDDDGVEIHIEGAGSAIQEFLSSLNADGPAAARITAIEVSPAEFMGFETFSIRASSHQTHPSTHVSPDLPVCDACIKEMFDPRERRFHYPYINCTNCGPRYSVILGLPYDRCNTTMREWEMDGFCAAQYRDPMDRRFHAQPVACPSCGPHYRLAAGKEGIDGNEAAIRRAVKLLKNGAILAVKGLGGYHLACDARNESAVEALRARKFRKEKPFALMPANLSLARDLAQLTPESEALLTSPERPIVLARAKVHFAAVSPDNDDLGIMLPYAPLHHLLFNAGAPDVLVMTSANRSNEPIAYQDEDALEQLADIADAFLIGERPIARRVEDSIARSGTFGPVILRRSRGYAPASVAEIPSTRPILALGADLKNSITLVVNGQAFMSQYIGDLDQYAAFVSFRETIQDLVSMYEVSLTDAIVARDAHPEYRSSAFALELEGGESRAIQHHRAHIASVLAERGAWEKRVLGVSFDGTGYGDDGSIWGGEIFAGSVVEGMNRIAHLRPAVLAGGDAAARRPVQAAAGFLHQIDQLPDVISDPFHFPERYHAALDLIRGNVRTFRTTSMGRLFDSAAALLGFTREVSFEGQAAMWVEQLARKAADAQAYPFPFADKQLDFRPLLGRMARDRCAGRDIAECARAFHRGLANGLIEAAKQLCEEFGLDTIVLSGGVFQNELLLGEINCALESKPIKVWTNSAVPPNDGGISLGQAALAAFLRTSDRKQSADYKEINQSH